MAYRRGASLIVTVLLSLTAATIAIVMLGQSGAAVQAEAFRSDQAAAVRTVDDLQARFASRLATDPTFFLDEVWDAERARVCLVDGDPTAVQPGQVWPASCGTTWTYQTPATATDTAVEIVAPTAAAPQLTVRFAARDGRATAGITVRYVPEDSGRWALWSDSTLNLSGSAGQTLTVDGSVYAGGNLTLPDGGSVTLTPAQMVTEAELVGPRQSGFRYYAADANLQATVPVDNVRVAVPRPGTVADLTGWVARLDDLACGTASNWVSNTVDRVCVTAGGTLRVTNGDGDGTNVNVPGDTVAYLVIPGNDGLAVWAAPSVPLPPLGAAAGTSHPGSAGFWTANGAVALGTVPYPTSGVATFDRDVHVGLCGNAFTGSGTCTVAQAATAVTVVAGTVTDPRDVIVAGPLDAAAPVTVVATDAVRVAWWSRPAGGILDVDATLIGLALGDDITGGFGTVPVTFPADSGNDDPNWAGQVNIVGGVTAARTVVPLPGFRTTAVTLNPTAGPWAPAASNSWERRSAQVLTPADVDTLLN